MGYMRRNFLVPVPSFESFDALNTYLEQRCLERMDAQLRGHTETIGQRMERGPGRPAAPASGGIRRLRQAGKPGEFAVPCQVQDQRLLGAGGLRIPGRAGSGLRRRSGDQLRNRGHRQDIPDHTNETTSSTTPSTTCCCWSVSRAPWTRPRRCRAGNSPMSSGRCGVCWNPAWDGRGKREYVQVLRLLGDLQSAGGARSGERCHPPGVAEL